MSKGRILIVEDEMIVARDLQLALVRMGYSTPAIAISGKLALKSVAKVRPDLVLMDIVLKGGMDGIETAQQLTAEFDVPIVYVTAHSDRGTFARARLTRPCGYILKPFDEKRLAETVEAALAHERRERSRAGSPSPEQAATVLVVQASLELQSVITVLLCGRGYEVVLSNRATDAVPMLRETRFDLIIADLVLPDARGTVFVRGLRREMGIATPVIVLADMVTPEDLAFVKAEAVSCLLSSSGDFEFRLLTEVDRALGRSAAPEPEETRERDWATVL
ncbi:MAG: response regulator [Candidatus Latescibacterota bacterium]|jgi:CheY-like chemotaxis protein